MFPQHTSLYVKTGLPTIDHIETFFHTYGSQHRVTYMCLYIASLDIDVDDFDILEGLVHLVRLDVLDSVYNLQPR